MTTAEVLTELAKIYPQAKSYDVQAQVERTYRGDGTIRTYFWIFVPDCYRTGSKKCYSSDRSWDHVVAMAKADNEDVWPEDHSNVEVEAA